MSRLARIRPNVHAYNWVSFGNWGNVGLRGPSRGQTPAIVNNGTKGVRLALPHKLFVIGWILLFGLIQFFTKVGYWVMLLTKYSTYTPMPNASHSTSNTLVKSRSCMTGASIILFLISPNALVAALAHLNSPCFIQSVIGDIMVLNPLTNQW